MKDEEKRTQRRLYGLLAGILLVALAVQVWSLEKRTLRPRERAADPALVEGQVDVNRAGAALLAALPGLGETLAERIVAEREANGPFDGVDDLARVPGIGASKLDALRPYLRAEPVAEVPEPTAAPPAESAPAVTIAPTPAARSTPVPTEPAPGPVVTADETPPPSLLFADAVVQEEFLRYMNTAPLAQLVRCPQIGESLAVQILGRRKRTGPFGTVEDVISLEGIDESSLWPIYRFLRSQALENTYIEP